MLEVIVMTKARILLIGVLNTGKRKRSPETILL
jgi:hypothetical protein